MCTVHVLVSILSALDDNNALTARRLRDDMRESELIDYEDDGGDSLLDSVAEMEQHDGLMRIFIALFDYDPDTMSPNPDAGSLELAFKEGQLLRVCCCYVRRDGLYHSFSVMLTW